jgi:acyl carrier protein
MTTVYTRIAALIATTFGVPPQEITPEATFADLELDSIALVELVLVVEQEFGIKLPDDELSDKDDVGRAAELIAVTLGSVIESSVIESSALESSAGEGTP